MCLSNSPYVVSFVQLFLHIFIIIFSLRVQHKPFLLYISEKGYLLLKRILAMVSNSKYRLTLNI